MAKEFKRSGGKDFKSKKSFSSSKDRKDESFPKKAYYDRKEEGSDSDKTKSRSKDRTEGSFPKKTHHSRKEEFPNSNNTKHRSTDRNDDKGPEKSYFDRNEGASADNAKKRDYKDSYSEKKSGSRTNNSDNRTRKPAFERSRDDSRPSDFGTPKKREYSPFERGRKKPFSDNPKFKKRLEGGTEKPLFKERADTRPGSFKKDKFSDKPDSIKKSYKGPNPLDMDESDLNYGKEKTFSSKTPERSFKRKTYGKKSTVSKPQQTSELTGIRLNKYIANAGICSRREADDLIESGVVQVNGKTITEMGFRVQPTDIIKYGGQTLRKERLVYLILNKPKDYITTAEDPQNRKTVLELIQGACAERIYPVGRLDRATTGLLMFTNDGELTKKLTHPRYGVRKIYHAELDKPLKRSDLDKIAEGLELEDGLIKVDEVSYVGDGTDKTQIGVEIHSGKNRIVRRIFEHLGYNIRKLDRVMFGSLTKKDLPRGRYRMLTDAEVGMLKMISAE